MRLVFFYSWLHMAFAGGWSSLVLGSISDCWNPPAPAVSQPSKGGRPHQKSFWWWQLGRATDILVLITDPLYGGWNLFPYSVTNLVRMSHSFFFIVVLVSVWHNPPRKIMCSLEACFHILHTSWDTLIEFCSWTVSHYQVNSGRWASLPKKHVIWCDICGWMHSHLICSWGSHRFQSPWFSLRTWLICSLLWS